MRESKVQIKIDHHRLMSGPRIEPRLLHDVCERLCVSWVRECLERERENDKEEEREK